MLCFVCIVYDPSYLHQADLLWARCPRRARETSACPELERSCRGGSAQNRGSAEGTEAGCPRSMHAGLNPQRGLLVKDRRPKWHHAGKQDRCKMDGQRHEGFSSESNQWFRYICVAEEVCVFITATVKFNGLLDRSPHVLAQGAWSEETRWRKGSLTVFLLFAPLQDL